MTEVSNENETAGENLSESNLPKVAWNIKFVAMMTAPVEQTGKFFSDKEVTDEEGRLSFETFVREELGLSDFSVLSFERVPVDPVDFIPQAKSTETIN